jgi:hypothetical protein
LESEENDVSAQEEILALYFSNAFSEKFTPYRRLM